MSPSLSPQGQLWSEHSPRSHAHSVADLAAAQATQADVSPCLRAELLRPAMGAASSNLTEQLLSHIAFYFPSLGLKSSSDYSQASIQLTHKQNLPQIHKRVSQLPCLAPVTLELNRRGRF